jgi:rhodanese-related sulfurtransferase
VRKERAVTASQSTVDDVPVKQVWERLVANPDSVLIDVRTRSEWAFVGLPELSSIGRRPVLVEWLGFPDNRVNAGFVDELTGQLDVLGIGRNAELYFICRSGGRSRQAAQVMAAAGYLHCHNVAEGFEGPLDADRHRGVRSGWKAEGLPWSQG